MGVLTHVSGHESARHVYDRTIRLAQAAESAGVESFWVAQHRFGAQRGHLPSPLVLLGAIARETGRIRLGTASIAAPLEDPRRLAEDVAVVDTLSGGRMELGLGSGSDPAASALWGLDHDRRHRRMWEVVDELRRLFDSGDPDAGTRLVPPVPGVPSRMWVTAGSAESVAAAAERGIGLIAGRGRVGAEGPAGEDRRAAGLVDDYRAAGGVRVAISRPVIATTDPTAVVAAVNRRAREDGSDASGIAIGTPTEMRQRFDTDPGVMRADLVLIHTRPVEIPLAVEMESIRLLAEEVAARR
ncbi:LLM class flavin-dependent oxidoreductase [Dietzia sp. 179-F 9C3 NHS]|uniref:LLM class flavin-dependent oxidoreductase n=1 Tax=Dietzia sp. 179-F 9C3 NHS TaxID=3374295 RepID=UPI003879D44B